MLCYAEQKSAREELPMHPRPRPVAVAVAVLAALLIVGLSGCGSGGSSSGGGAASPAATTAAPAQPGGAAAPATRRQAEAVVLADGRHPVIIKQVNLSEATVTFDLIQMYWGDEATREAAKDHQESPPPNDYYIRNVNPRLRTMPVAAGARLTVTAQTAGQAGGNAAGAVPADLPTIAAKGRNHIFWATVQGGRIRRLEEQYVP
jgi:hypothetical protein